MRTPLIVVGIACSLAALSDLRRFRIANRLTLGLLLSGCVYHVACGGWAGVVHSLTGAAFGFVTLICLYAAGGMGAGDVKLTAGIGAWLGVRATAEVVVVAAIAAGVYALLLIIVTRRLGQTLAGIRQLIVLGPSSFELPVQDAATRADRRQTCVPFAAMLLVGLAVKSTWL
jgi:prepilin peptidase CpaA